MRPFLYQKLIKALLVELGSGHYAEGARFLSKRKVSRIWGVSEPTTKHALAFLTEQKLIRPYARSGLRTEPGFQRRAQVILHSMSIPTLDAVPGWDEKRRKLIRSGHPGSPRLGLIFDSPELRSYELSNTTEKSNRRVVLQIIRSFFRIAMEEHCEVDFFFHDWTMDKGRELIADLGRRQLDGLFLLKRTARQPNEDFINRLVNLDIPLVIGFAENDYSPATTVNFNNIGMGHEAGLRFAAAGHSNILIVNSNNTNRNIDLRIEGFFAGLQEGGVDCGPNIRRIHIAHRQRSEALYKILADKRTRPSALFLPAIHRYVEVGGILRELGLRVPRDISVLGCGHAEVLKELGVQLDLMEMDFYGIGRVACEQVLAKIRGEPTAKMVLLQSNYIRNGSIAVRRQPPVAGRRLKGNRAPKSTVTIVA